MGTRVLVSVKKSPRTPVYAMGVAARLCGMPIHRLRWIERAGLVAPSRTEGNQRLFCDEDLERLGRIRELLAQRVNLSGIRIILRIQSRG